MKAEKTIQPSSMNLNEPVYLCLCVFLLARKAGQKVGKQSLSKLLAPTLGEEQPEDGQRLCAPPVDEERGDDHEGQADPDADPHPHRVGLEDVEVRLKELGPPVIKYVEMIMKAY